MWKTETTPTCAHHVTPAWSYTTAHINKQCTRHTASRGVPLQYAHRSSKRKIWYLPYAWYDCRKRRGLVQGMLKQCNLRLIPCACHRLHIAVYPHAVSRSSQTRGKAPPTYAHRQPHHLFFIADQSTIITGETAVPHCKRGIIDTWSWSSLQTRNT